MILNLNFSFSYTTSPLPSIPAFLLSLTKICCCMTCEQIRDTMVIEFDPTFIIWAERAFTLLFQLVVSPCPGLLHLGLFFSMCRLHLLCPVPDLCGLCHQFQLWTFPVKSLSLFYLVFRFLSLYWYLSSIRVIFYLLLWFELQWGFWVHQSIFVICVCGLFEKEKPTLFPWQYKSWV